MTQATSTYISCNLHAQSFIKGGEREDYDDDSNLKHQLGLSGEYAFSYDYPLSRIAVFKHTITPDMTGEDLLALARMDYGRIYREEEEAVGNPGHITGMLNRQTSQGPYGIWGHDFSDLFFEGIEYDSEKRTIEFSMGS
jgi:hypothetical protein